MSSLKDMTPEQLRALADKKERDQKPDIVNFQEAKPAEQPKVIAPSEAKVGEATFHVQSGLEDDWDFQEMAAEFEDAAKTNDNAKIVAMTKEVISYMFVESYDEIMDTLRTLHPEDERPHVHVDDISQLIRDGSPKALSN